MKRTMVAMVAAAMIVAGMARGTEPLEFAGTWLNINPKTTGITQVEIGIFKTTFRVHAWGACTPTDCDWGIVSVLIPPRLGDTFTVQYDFGYAVSTLAIQWISHTSLHMHETMNYAPGDPRKDFEKDEYFYRSGSGAPLPDLQITGLTIPAPVVVSQAVPWTWVTATVRNNGPGILSTGTIKAVFDSCTRNGQPETHSGYITFDYTAPLMPGQEATHDFAVGSNSTWLVGQHTIRLRVDPDNTVAESNEGNNLSGPLSFDIANERFLAGTIRYNGQPLTNYTQVPVSYNWLYDATTGQYPTNYFFWYDTQTGHYLLSGLPNDNLYVGVQFRVAGAADFLGGNYLVGYNVVLSTLTDAQAMAYDIPAEKILHLLEPQDNGQILDYQEAYWQCLGTRFAWEPLTEAVKYRIRIDTYRDSAHPLGWGFEANVLETEVTDPTYTPDLPVPAAQMHYEMSITGYNAASEKLGTYMNTFSGSMAGYGWNYGFKLCPSCTRADINRDCRVGLEDFAILAEEWLMDTR